jgi:hypothetical protein
MPDMTKIHDQIAVFDPDPDEAQAGFLFEEEPEGEFETEEELEDEDELETEEEPEEEETPPPLKRKFTGSADTKTIAKAISAQQDNGEDAPQFLILIDLSGSMTWLHGAMSGICSTIYGATQQVPGSTTTVVQMGGYGSTPFEVQPDRGSTFQLKSRGGGDDYFKPALSAGLYIMGERCPDIQNQKIHIFVLSDGGFTDGNPYYMLQETLNTYPQLDMSFLMPQAYATSPMHANTSERIQSFPVLDRGRSKIMKVVSGIIRGNRKPGSSHSPRPGA